MAKEVIELLKSFCRERFALISDGDIDGILGASLVSMKLDEIGCYGNMISIDFPPPSSLVNRRIPRSILVELPPSRGYVVEDEALIFDHHEFVGVKLVGREGIELISYITNNTYPSVSSMIREILEVMVPKGLEPILLAADLIDSGRSKENEYAWMIHKAYLYHIEDQQMRNNLYRWIINGDIKKIIEWAERGAEGYEKSREKIPEIITRTQTIGFIATSWIDQGLKEEKIAMREAMLELEKKYDVVLILEVDNNLVKRAHIGSMHNVNVKKIIERILEELRRLGINAAGGGRVNVGGIQIPGGIELEKMKEILIKISNENIQ